MAHQYVPVLWNRQKKRYDLFVFIGIILYLLTFVALTAVLKPNITAEALVVRATGSLAVLMLHIILAIGPLSRLDTRFLPLLYNRRHLGVTMFVVAFAHGGFSIVQFHALGDANPFVSIFISNPEYGTLVHFPFQTLGFFALIIFYLMAATSHDFWLVNLGPKFWKAMHMMVYIAYALVIMHVALGIAQSEPEPIMLGLLGIGLFTIISLHVIAAFREAKNDREGSLNQQGYVYVGAVDQIPENEAVTININGEKIAIFKFEGKLSAVSNVCRHQNGPLGEGKIIDGCITCPWHGYQYLPHNGCSPPPFSEKVETFDVILEGDKIYVHPKPYEPGTERPPAVIGAQ
ncbi:MAG: ferric reductase-like transmembrane domain-containing protein [Cytophagales bacterium]|nr:ferric reductase-like transmembrane domain-containing protein [Cytophagales bacterium]